MASYEDIFSTLKGKILEGAYNVRVPIPSERALMRSFGASRNAVRHAIDELEKARLVRRHHGRRTEVVYGGRGHRIGLIPCVADSAFFQPLALRISELCTEGGYSLMFAATGLHVGSGQDVSAAAAKVLMTAKEFVAQKVSGVLFQPVSFLPDAEALNEQILSVFAKANLPVVLLDYDVGLPPKRSACDVVGIDNITASLRICEHLVAAGARKIHFFRRPNCSNVVSSRMRGVMLGVTMAGLPWGAESVLTCEIDDARAIARHLRGRNRPDAIVCGFDALAVKVLESAAALGIDVPRQLKVVGFDDSFDARLTNPPLTTIRQPSEDIAEAAFGRLQARILGQHLPPMDILLPAPLVVRGSTASEKNAQRLVGTNRFHCICKKEGHLK